MIAAARLCSVLLLLAGPLALRRHNPISSFTVTPVSGPPPLTVNVDGSASTGAHGPITAYSWDWGDGSPLDSGVTAAHVYAATGTYEITLQVTDSTALTATSRQNIDCITAGNLAPSATIDTFTPAAGDAPLNVAFAGTGQDAAPPMDLLEHRWNFGDGTPDAVFTGLTPGQPSSGNHTYTSPGSYACTFSVRDGEGILSSTIVTAVATAGGVPFASFSVTPTAGPPPFQVAVDASASFDSNGSITAYTWTWGDGSPSSSGVTSSHTYTATATYTIRLTVTDNTSLTSFAERNVNCMSAGNVPPSGVIQGAVPQSGAFPLPVRFLGFGHDDNGPLEHRWDFGDGSAPQIYAGVSNHSTTTPSHLYALPGTYLCTLRVKDSENITSTTSTSVTVVDPATSPQRLGRRACGSTGLEPALLLLLARWRRRRK